MAYSLLARWLDPGVGSGITRRRLGCEDEMHVTKLVPQVAASQGSLVCALDLAPVRQPLEQGEMGGTRFMQARQQGVKDPCRRTGRDHMAGQAGRGAPAPAFFTATLKCASRCCSDCQYAPPAGASRVHRCRSLR